MTTATRPTWTPIELRLDGVCDELVCVQWDNHVDGWRIVGEVSDETSGVVYATLDAAQEAALRLAREAA